MSFLLDRDRRVPVWRETVRAQRRPNREDGDPCRSRGVEGLCFARLRPTFPGRFDPLESTAIIGERRDRRIGRTP